MPTMINWSNGIVYTYTLKTKEETADHCLKKKSPKHKLRALYLSIVRCSTEKDIVTSGTISQNGRINNFTTGATLPRIKRADKVIILFSIHASFTLRTSHGVTSYFISSKESLSLQNVHRGTTRDMPTSKKHSN